MKQNKKQNYLTKKDFEIKKMTTKIRERYQVVDEKFANEIAVTLYNYGIGNDKFNKYYYGGKFDLDEVINHLIKKKCIIHLKDHIPKTVSSSNNPNEKLEIIKFPQDKSLYHEALILQVNFGRSEAPKIKKRTISNK